MFLTWHAVLTTTGLLDAIRANTAEFLAMLNEPVAPGGGAGGVPGMPGMPGGAGQPTPAQLAQIFQGMPAEERARIAQQFGMSPEQFTQMTQMMAQMSPEQLQQIMGSMPPGMVRSKGNYEQVFRCFLPASSCTCL